MTDTHPATQAGALQAASNLVPGQMHCARCKFQLTRTNLYVNSGTVGAGDSKTEPCPNGCGPLWPVTWEQAAREAWATCETLFERAKAAEDALAAVNPPRLVASQPNAAPVAEVVATDEMFAEFSAIDNSLSVEDMRKIIERILVLAAPAVAIDAREQDYARRYRQLRDLGAGMEVVCNGELLEGQSLDSALDAIATLEKRKTEKAIRVPIESTRDGNVLNVRTKPLPDWAMWPHLSCFMRLPDDTRPLNPYRHLQKALRLADKLGDDEIAFAIREFAAEANNKD